MPKELVLKEQDTYAQNNSRWTPVIQKRLDEGLFILVAAISLFVLLSLTSYNKADPGWFSQTNLLNTGNRILSNSGGLVGAYLADILLCFLGILSYCLPALAIYLAWIRLSTRQYLSSSDENNEESINDTLDCGNKLTATNNSIRLLGAFLLVLGSSALASFEFPVSLNIFPHTTGGIIGNSFSQGLNVAFSHQGTVLLLVAMCFIGITLLTGLSWIATSEIVGMHALEWSERAFLCIRKFFESAYYSIIQWIKKKIQERNNNLRDLDNNTDNGIEQMISSMPSSVSIPVPPLSASVQPVISDVFEVEIPREKSPRIHEKTISELTASMAMGVAKDPRDQITINMNTQSSPETKYSPEPRIVSSATVASEPTPVFSHATILDKATSMTIPPLSLLEPPEKPTGKGYSGEQLETMAREVEQRLLDFGIESQVVAVNPGPVITRFELQLAAGVKVSRITGLAKDLARSLSVISVRVVEVIPGKPVIGLELPNQFREMVRISEVFSREQFQQALSPISMALGVDISGYPVVVDLAKMPHLLVAGTTGSGKSVGLNAMLLSILFKATPEQVRLILVDPKMLEFSIYDRIPHLLTPVVTDMKEAAGALRWSVAEMERRYKLMSVLGVRNLAAYNTLVKEFEEKGDRLKDPFWKPTQDMQEVSPYLSTLPYIVVVIDELADMMMIVGKKVEQLIARIAQKARAAGIHLILATQRPSVDVLTGLIKSNIPTRISFQVSSKIDSRTILDQQGADQLLGHGDMLYLTPGSGAPVRIHGAFVDDKEVHRVTDAWRERGDPQYVDIILRGSGDGEGSSGDMSGEDAEDADPLYDEAVRFVTETRKASISSVQRRLKVGYNRAARLIEEMERTGVVSSMESNGMRDVLAPPPPSDD